MGTEFLVVFIVIPIAIWVVNGIRILQKKNTVKHAILLVIGICALVYMSISSYLGGWHPMQGFIIGSVFYGPIYLFAFIILTGALRLRSDP